MKTLSSLLLFLVMFVPCNSFAALRVGSKAPRLILRTAQGKSYVDLHDLVGKQVQKPARAVVLSFFATWCNPCLKERLELIRLQKKYHSRGIRFLVIASGSGQTEQELYLFGKENPSRLTTLVDTYRRVARLWKVNRIPTSFMVDSKGRIKARYVGYNDVIKKKLKTQLQTITKKVPTRPSATTRKTRKKGIGSAFKPSIALAHTSFSGLHEEKVWKSTLGGKFLFLSFAQQKRLLQRHR